MGKYGRQRRRFPGLNRRARRQARVATGPDRRAAQRQIGHIRGQTRKETGRIKKQGQRAARSARRSTSRQADFERGISVKGLGPYKGMTRQMLNQGAASVERYGKGLGSLARRGARLDTRELQQAAKEDIYQTRESVRGIEDQEAAARLAELVKGRRETQAAALQEQTEAQVEALQNRRERRQERGQDAYSAVGELIEKGVPRNSQQWQQFSEALRAKNPLISPRALDDAVNRYRTTEMRRKINTGEVSQTLDYWKRILGL